jgi:hypothetical protein
VTERLLGIRPLLAVSGLAGLVLGVLLYPYGLAANLPTYSKSEAEIVAAARGYAAKLGADTSHTIVMSQTIGSNGERWEWLATRYGIDEARRAAAAGDLPMTTWRVRFRRNPINSLDEDPGSAEISLGPGGTLSGFEIPHEKPSGEIAREEALRTATAGLTALGVDLAGYVETSDADEKKEETTKLRVQTEGAAPPSEESPQEPPATGTPAKRQRFVWTRDDGRWPGTKQSITATVTSAGLVDFKRDYEIVDGQRPSTPVGMILEGVVFGFSVTALFAIILGAVASRLFAGDYVDRSRAAFVGTLVSASITIVPLLNFAFGDSLFPVAMFLTVVGSLIALVMGAAWLAGEADAYFAWGRRNTEGALALLTFHPRARQVGRELLEGFFWGWLLLGLLATGAAAVAATGVGVWRSYDLFALDVRPTPLFWATIASWVLCFSICCLLFLPAWLHRLTKRMWVAAIGATLTAALYASVLRIADTRFGNIPASLSWGLVFGAAVVAISIRRGWMTALVTTFVFSVFYYGLAPASVATTADALWTASGLLIFTAPAALVVYAAPSLVEAKIQEAPPPRVSHMMEQARREQELDIARRVQVRLLPAEDPVVEGFEIAATCHPATEVGGDYFDYFRLEDGRFGVAVGDVSGKGVPAAFSMTLTKGFMEVAAAETRDPATALINANGHLRDHLTKNTFVTMAYAILDPESRTVTCARAGHNPPAVVRDGGAPEFVESAGVALGATECEQLSSMIETRRLEFSRGDAIVFYTDGVTEAMNRRREEFGEARLLAAIARLHDGASARALLEGLLDEIQAHSSGAEQHDDITIVVVKAA